MMKDIIITRLIHWKKQWPSLLFWILLPIIGTIVIMYVMDTVKDESKVPVGIVLEDDSVLANDLVSAIEHGSPLIQPIVLSETEARYRLTKHELDSVFIIPHQYEEKIKQHERQHLVTSYYTELSFAYPTIKEIVTSYVLQDSGRSKAAQTVQALTKQYDTGELWTWEEIVEESKLTEQEQNLLNTSFSFYNKHQRGESNDNIPLVEAWNIWAILSLLATFLLLDWPSKEAHSNIRARFPFIRMGLKQYLLLNLFVYVFIFFVIDVLTIATFYFVLSEEIAPIQFGVIMTYRLMICLAAFLLSIINKRVFSYYLAAFIITLFLAMSSGAILPLDGLLKYFQAIKWLNPLNDFLANDLSIQWLILFLLFTVVWRLRKERSYASS